jgi:hypothetical protein
VDARASADVQAKHTPGDHLQVGVPGTHFGIVDHQVGDGIPPHDQKRLAEFQSRPFVRPWSFNFDPQWARKSTRFGEWIR